MPKITTKDFTIAGKNYKCTVWYKSDDNFFFKDFPKDIERAAQITPLGHHTEDDLYEAYEAGIKRYEELIAALKKVIVFRITAAKPHVEDRYSKWADGGKTAFPDGVGTSYNSDMGFEITYSVKMMRKVGDATYFHNVDENDKPVGSGEEIKEISHWKIIDYTPAREASFKDLYERFDKMLMAFIGGFNQAEKFIDSIPTQKFLT